MNLNLSRLLLIIIFVLSNSMSLAKSLDCKFTTNIKRGILPLNVTIADKSEGSVEHRFWFIDGSILTDTSRIINYTFFKPGWHSIKLIVQNDKEADSLNIENAVYAGYEVPSFLTDEEYISKPYFKNCHPIKYWENENQNLQLCSYCYGNNIFSNNIYIRQTNLDFEYKNEIITDKIKSYIPDKYSIAELNEDEIIIANSLAQGYIINFSNKSYDFFELDYQKYLNLYMNTTSNFYKISEIIKQKNKLVFFIHNIYGYTPYSYYLHTNLNLRFNKVTQISNFGKVKDTKLKDNGNYIFLNTQQTGDYFVPNIIVELNHDFSPIIRAFFESSLIEKFEIVSDNEIVFVEGDKNGNFRIRFHNYLTDAESSYSLPSNIKVNAIEKIKSGLFVGAGKIDNYLGFFFFNKDFSFKKEYIIKNRKGKLTDAFKTSDNCLALSGHLNYSTDKVYSYTAKTINIDALIDGTNVPIEKPNNDICIIPNPANNYFLIKSGGEYCNQFRGVLYDMRGQILMNFKNSYKVNIHHLKPGLYIVKLMAGNMIKIEKLIVTK